MKHIFILFVVVLLFACNSGNKADAKDLPLTVVGGNMVTIPEKPPLDTLLLPKIYNEGIEILLPGMYRDYKPSDYAYMLDEEWCELYRDTLTNDYYLRKAAIKIGKFDDQCLGDSTTYVVANGLRADEDLFKSYSVLLINGLKYQNKVLDIPVINQGMVWAGNTMPFVLNGQQYSLSATGYTEVEEPESEDDRGLRVRWEDVLNYKLYLTTNIEGKEITQLLVAIPNSNDTNVTILFVGDLDGDGKPDFVFNTARDYEEARVVLFLSSKAKKGEIVRCVGESSFQFDC